MTRLDEIGTYYLLFIDIYSGFLWDAVRILLLAYKSLFCDNHVTKYLYHVPFSDRGESNEDVSY